MSRVVGNFYSPRQSSTIRAQVEESDDGVLSVFRDDSSSELIHRSHVGDYRFGIAVANVAVEVNFNDGSLFEPDDVEFRWRSLRKTKSSVIEKLETHWLMVFVAALLIPIFIWWSVVIAIPNAAESAVEVLPELVFEQAENQTLEFMDRTMMKPSKLPESTRQNLQEEWNQALAQLSLSEKNYKLMFRHSRLIGPNAFALPNGAVVLTDALVEMLKDKEDAILAVMLHEIGHVEYKHGMKIVARSLAITIFFALLLGDIEGAGEYVIGASTSLLDSSYSRDMEREADEYAFQKLSALGKSPDAFALAMESFALTDFDDGENDPEKVLQYFSSHPSTFERIASAREAAESSNDD